VIYRFCDACSAYILFAERIPYERQCLSACAGLRSHLRAQRGDHCTGPTAPTARRIHDLSEDELSTRVCHTQAFGLPEHKGISVIKNAREGRSLIDRHFLAWSVLMAGTGNYWSVGKSVLPIDLAFRRGTDLVDRQVRTIELFFLAHPQAHGAL